ncbi:hypothetical protein EK21DRAFT_54500 [Setomelanomma holmii]|uniref:Amino acid transporter n=1 Tax=Setomelanomma holmii TaxID=210430 RepID=A0A9P4LT36_9PLEO|nr:hypothetical protein EK21DRAFT_54500 [Setomelanomma holmii]
MDDSKHEVQQGLSSLSDTDARELALVGKKSVLRRNFSPIAILGLSCSLMITWEGLFSVFIFGLLNGGPAGLIYSYLICWAGWACVAATMGELVSIYVPERWQGTLMVWALLLLCLAFNTFMSKGLPKVETAILWLHIILFIVVLIVITVMSPMKSGNEEVWTTFLNGGGYESKGLSFMVGWITPIFAFSGADGAVHMVEEIRNSSRVVPWALMSKYIPPQSLVALERLIVDQTTVSILINGVTGLAMLIAILYCIGDIDKALTTPTGYPFIEILTQGVGSIGGGTALSALIVVMFCCATLGIVATSSRQLWAFARDNAVPNAKMISYVHPTMKVPVVAICITVMITCLLSLINIGSATVFNAIVSLTVAGFFGSYLLPFSFFLYTRIRHPGRLVPGPWTLGEWGPIVNAIAIVWSIVVFFFSFWPSSVPVTAMNMNWSCVLWSAVMIFAVVFWFVHGKKVYKGPVIETDATEAGMMRVG